MVSLKSYGKINLNIHILPKKLSSGLYPVKYVICQIDLYDEIYIENINNKILLTSNDKKLPKTEKNLAYKAAVLLKEEVKNKSLGAKIKIIKNIPIKAGFGGGSSNAASVLLSLIKIWDVKINKEKILKIAGELGKEVFYLLKGGVCEVLHDGTVVNKIVSNMPKIWLVLISPKQKKPSTGHMFKSLMPKGIGKKQIKFNLIKKAILNNDKKAVIKNLHNDFETYALKKYPDLIKIKQDLLYNGALNAIMTGAGLYIVGYFDKKKTAEQAYKSLRKKYTNAILTNTK
ncbi:MAG: 4-(cytidine 5'-diphospho)-2-C-methyl-D-erythritol kinase [Patescibacteria group bacterium]